MAPQSHTNGKEALKWGLKAAEQEDWMTGTFGVDVFDQRKPEKERNEKRTGLVAQKAD